jgi:hypothetical protein
MNLDTSGSALNFQHAPRCLLLCSCSASMPLEYSASPATTRSMDVSKRLQRDWRQRRLGLRMCCRLLTRLRQVGCSVIRLLFKWLIPNSVGRGRNKLNVHR